MRAFIAARLPNRRPVFPQIGGEIVHRHPIHTGAPLVLPHALERAREIPPLDDLLYHSWQFVGS
jgi:hypothetical protein